MGDVDIIGHNGHRVPLVDDALIELVMGRLVGQIVDNGNDVQAKQRPGAPLAENPIGAEIAQPVVGRPPTKAIAPLLQVQGHISKRNRIQRQRSHGSASQAHPVQHRPPVPRVPGKAHGIVSVLQGRKSLLSLPGEDDPVSFRLHRGKGALSTLGWEGPMSHRGVGQPGRRLSGGKGALLPQLHLHHTGTGKGQHIVLAQGKAVALEVLPPRGAEKGLGLVGGAPLDHLLPRVHVKQVLKLRRRGFNPPGRFIHDVFPILVLGEHLGTLGNGDGGIYGIMGGKLEQSGGRHRVGHLKAG